MKGWVKQLFCGYCPSSGDDKESDQNPADNDDDYMTWLEAVLIAIASLLILVTCIHAFNASISQPAIHYHSLFSCKN